MTPEQRKMVLEMSKVIEDLVAVGINATEHIREGSCPHYQNVTLSDPNCPACQAVEKASALSTRLVRWLLEESETNAHK